MQSSHLMGITIGQVGRGGAFLAVAFLILGACDKKSGQEAGSGSPATSAELPSSTASSTAASAATATATATAAKESCSCYKGKGNAESCVKECEVSGGYACTCAVSVLQTTAKAGRAQDDPALRLKLNQRGCDTGDGKSCSRLGTQHEKGDGVPKDPGKAHQIWAESCANGGGSGCGHLGVSYGYPREGQSQDLKKALEWFDKGCQQGVQGDCKDAKEIRAGDWPTVVALEDLMVAPQKYYNRQVILIDVMAMRITPSSGRVFRAQDGPSVGAISVIVMEKEEARRAWLDVPGFPGRQIRYMGGIVQEEMRRGGGGCRFAVAEIGLDSLD